MYTIVLILHILVAILMMAVVLMQSGRGDAMGSAFGGGGGSQTLFGGRGATSFLTKATWILGGGFMATSLILALTIGHRQGIGKPKSLLRENPISVPTAPLSPSGGSELPGTSPVQGGSPGTAAPATPPPSTPAAPPSGGSPGAGGR
jgi:preprotein translocase subunit SecG